MSFDWRQATKFEPETGHVSTPPDDTHRWIYFIPRGGNTAITLGYYHSERGRFFSLGSNPNYEDGILPRGVLCWAPTEEFFD